MRLLLHAASLLIGGAVAIAAVAVHRMGPLGLALAVVTTFVVAWSLWTVPAPSRLATSYAAGWAVPFVLTVLGRPEGDYAVASDVPGYVLMVSGFVLVFAGIVAGPRAHDSRSLGRPT